MNIVTIIMLIGIGFFIGFVTCFVFAMLIFDRRTDGKLNIDMTKPEKDLYCMSFTTPLEELPKRKKVRLKVEVNKPLTIWDDEEIENRLLKELEDSQDLQRSI